MTKQSPVPAKLWVFAQCPANARDLIIPVEASSREEAVRIVESDPQLVGKPLTAKVIAGQEGVTDGQRDFLIFSDSSSFLHFLEEHGIVPS